MKNLLLTSCFFIACQSYVFSQVIPDGILQDDTILYEKLYLHTDREIYSPGDDIWFKSYLVSGINNQPIPGFKNIYVELIAEDGRVIDQRLMLSIYGVSNNDFHLPDTLPTGQYTVRAYTRYLQNFGEESLFHQKIAVSRTTDTPVFKEKKNEQKRIDVSFLPEGGHLVLNAANYVAFKAIDKTGRGIQVSGKIEDETGQKVATFTSRYKGMGTVVFMPEEGKKYFARVDNYPDFKYSFEDALPDGVAMHYRQNGNNLQFILNRNIKSTGNLNLTLLASHKGQELFTEEVEMTGFQHPVDIYKGFFPHGITKITLYDERNNILAERLVFVRNADANILSLTTDKEEYHPREKIKLDIESLLDPGEDSIVTGLSVAVVNEAYFDEGGRTQTIESYLLLDSELKVPVESPASCFVDGDSISAGEKLDLVMMVNGWRRYYWDELQDYFNKPLPGWDDTGLTIEGQVKTLWGSDPVVGGTVELGPFSREFLILKDTTDMAGKFSFNRLFLKDSALVMLNAFNQKGRQSTQVFYEPVALFDTVVPLEKINRTARNIELHEEYSRASFNQYLAEREFDLEHGSILLGEVDIVEEYKSGPVVTGNFGFHDLEFTLTDADQKYDGIYKYLHFEVPGVYEYEIDSIRMHRRHIRFFVDDVFLDEEIVKYLPINNIVKVEVYYGSNIVSILTKTGWGSFHNEFVRIIHNRITPRIRGFRQARKFYAPAYPLSEQDSTEKPDQRPTLYWEPYVILENGSANLEFYTSDMPGKYRIISEGINKNGKIIFHEAAFDVVASDK